MLQGATARPTQSHGSKPHVVRSSRPSSEDAELLQRYCRICPTFSCVKSRNIWHSTFAKSLLNDFEIESSLTNFLFVRNSKIHAPSSKYWRCCGILCSVCSALLIKDTKLIVYSVVRCYSSAETEVE